MIFADAVVFVATSSGTGSFVFSGGVNSFRTPSQATSDGALVNGGTYSYFAVDSVSSPLQREWGHSVFTSSSGTFTRVVLGGISSGSDTGTSPVNFTVPPTVYLTALAEDLFPGISLDQNYSSTNNTLANVTGSSKNLSVTVASGHTYTFQAALFITSGATTGGYQAAIGGTATVTSIIYDGFASDSVSSGTPFLAYAQATSSGTAVARSTNTGNAFTGIYIRGTIIVNAGGTLTVQFAQNSTNATATVVSAGSYFLVQDVT